ncbi:right-handed parallel beta-helix repeat-containing protein [Streptomyces sp. NPDC050625]|uniref:right-handed parallel beta-helix repeat-containing protein n=1 Tax=Streptomyces sp. NPDC050625 TaxID=3154629 RepID=UPI00343CFB60
MAELCPGAVFNLSKTVYFTAPDQRIETQGLPTDGTRAVLRVASTTLAMAVFGHDQSGAVLQNVEVDGSRSQYGRLANADALIEMGGNSTGQAVRNVYAHHTRGWSDLHLFGGDSAGGVPACQQATLSGNLLTDAGTDTPEGTWADGISLDCGHTLVENNTIRDATDGGIVIFGAPGSTVRNNTITAATKVLLGGINMVDYGPDGGNYTGTVVSGNTIDAAGSLIKIAVAMGPLPWGCGSTVVNYGATVTGNTLRGAHMGYGFVANGVRDWTVTGNTDSSTHVGYVKASNCSGSIASAPSGFQSASVSNSTLQSDFLPNQSLTGLLGLTERPTTISLKANNGLFVTAEDAGAQPLIANRTQAGPWEAFDVTYLSGDQVQLRAEANGLFVTAEDAGTQPLIANRTVAQGWETFRMIRNPNRTVSLVAEANDMYVTSNNGTAPLIANQPANNGWEKFTLYAD